jgi:hypothetical protein
MSFSSKEKRLAYQREYAMRNREKLREQNRKWRETNREVLNAKDREEYAQQREAKISWQREYYQKNREQRLAWHREYREKNSELLKAQRKTDIARLQLAERQARRRTARSSWASQDAIRLVYAEARAKTVTGGVEHVVDHIVPLIHPLVCGLHNEFNLCVITRQENARKNNRYAPEWEMLP